MDLITSDPSSTQSSSKSTASAAPAATLPHQTAAVATASTDRKKKGMLMQIQSDTISAAKAALNPVRMPQKQKKKAVSYAQLARSIHELAATSDQLLWLSPHSLPCSL